MVKTFEIRFWNKVNKTNECWEWIGSKTAAGYGEMRVKSKTKLVHRLVFYILNLDFDENLCVLHKCDNRSCVNPEHLFQGTRKDNANDMKQKGRARGANGSKNYNAKLSEEQVLEIKSLLKEGITHQKIASRFNISRTTITNISNGKIWRCVGG